MSKILKKILFHHFYNFFFIKFSSQDGNGIWVVKSRAAAAPGSNENQNAQQHPQKMRKVQMSNVCG